MPDNDKKKVSISDILRIFIEGGRNATKKKLKIRSTNSTKEK